MSGNQYRALFSNGTAPGATSAAATLTVPVGALDHLVVSPSSATVVAGGSQAFTAEGFDAFGNDLGDVTGATVFTGSAGLACTAASCTSSVAGTHTVTGTDGSATGTASVTVTANALDVNPPGAFTGPVAFTQPVPLTGPEDVPPSKTSTESKPDKPKVSKVTSVRGVSTRIKVKVAEAGRIRTSGFGLQRGYKTAKKAETYGVPVTLSKRARRTLLRHGQVKVRVTVRFTSVSGLQASTHVWVTFKRRNQDQI
jgi:hypothetical protein